jgi:NitT/TauT family transport system substrate-binding protein
MFMRRIGTLLAAAALGLCAAFPASAETTKVSIGYVSAGDFITAFVAKDEGIFEKNGIDATLTQLTIATNGPAAVLSKSLDISMSTATILLEAAEGGLDLVAIAGVSRFYADNPKVSLVARTGSGIHKAADFKGKTIGVPGLNSVMDVGVRTWLKRNGVALGDVTFVEVVFPRMKDMLTSRTVDAVAVLEPFRSAIIKGGVGYNVVNYYSELNPNALSALWISTREWATANPKLITAFRKSLAEAADFIEKNPDKAKPIEKKYLGFNSPIKPSIALDLNAGDLDFYVKIITDLGLLRHPVDAAKLVWP